MTYSVMFGVNVQYPLNQSSNINFVVVVLEVIDCTAEKKSC